jgi:hypothetical protein
MEGPEYALSLKQPWATLLVYGRKFVEVRRWATERRGRVLIHAAGVADPRKQAWDQVPDDLQELAQLSGGIIGAAELTGCITYSSKRLFMRDRRLHLNDPSWFVPPLLYGFTFTRAVALPFRRYSGNVRFFSVQPSKPAAPSPSTRSRAAS